MKLWFALFSCYVASTMGCGEVDILAIDRQKVAGLSEGGTDDAAAPQNDGVYLEAESGQLSGGFTVGDDATASGGRFIQPPAGATSTGQPGAARALYDFVITRPGTYIIWGRIQSPDTAHNRFWVQVDGDSWDLWRITTGEVWYWNRVHNNTNYSTPLIFDLAPGAHTILVANATDGVRLDRLYLTSGGDRPPGNNTPCRPPDSIQVAGACVPSCGSLGGNQCGVPQCSAGRVVPGRVYDCGVCCIVP